MYQSIVQLKHIYASLQVGSADSFEASEHHVSHDSTQDPVIDDRISIYDLEKIMNLTPLLGEYKSNGHEIEQYSRNKTFYECMGNNTSLYKFPRFW